MINQQTKLSETSIQYDIYDTLSENAAATSDMNIELAHNFIEKAENFYLGKFNRCSNIDLFSSITYMHNEIQFIFFLSSE